jgi:hypothetical protein
MATSVSVELDTQARPPQLQRPTVPRLVCLFVFLIDRILTHNIGVGDKSETCGGAWRIQLYRQQ